VAAIHSVKNRIVRLSLPTRVKGRFIVELIHGRTGIVKRRLEFDNLITDAGLNSIGGGTSIGNHSWLAVGTGSTAPAVSDTSLESQLGNRTNNTGGFPVEASTGANNAYSEAVVTRQFDFGEVNGNLTELGFFSDSTGGSMLNRQLFRDEQGEPTTITKTSEDMLRVLIAWRVMTPLVDAQQLAVSITGSGNHDIEAGSVSRGSQDGWAGSTNTILLPLGFGNWPTGIQGNTGAVAVCAHNAFPTDRDSLIATGSTFFVDTDMASPAGRQSYVSGSFKREYQPAWGPGEANFTGGIGGVISRVNGTNSVRQMMMTFDPKIPKTDVERLVLELEYPFGRFEE
jgi:hypothetical protein